MRLFFVASNLPSAGHSVRAATVLVREALLALREQGHEVVLQPLLPATAALGPGDEAALAWAYAQGLDPRPTLIAPDGPPPRRLGLARDAAAGGIETFYPAYGLRSELATRIAAADPDAVFHLWSPLALAACAESSAPVFAYYGNPDAKPIDARLRHPALFDHEPGAVRLTLLRLANERRRRANTALMLTASWAACVTALDADYWRAEGHSDAFYLQNMWPVELPRRADAHPDPARNKVVASLGGLYATGNTFGLFFLGTEIAPALERRGDYELHVYGAGEPTAAVARALDRPSIRRRGFVDDIDREISSAKVFLLANNANPDFIGGHTRILHAWSLGTPVVSHRNLALAMPEVRHGENALLGDGAEEIAELVAEACADKALQARLAEGGRSTLERDFAPQVVMGRVVDHISATKE